MNQKNVKAAKSF